MSMAEELIGGSDGSKGRMRPATKAPATTSSAISARTAVGTRVSRGGGVRGSSATHPAYVCAARASELLAVRPEVELQSPRRRRLHVELPVGFGDRVGREDGLRAAARARLVDL